MFLFLFSVYYIQLKLYSIKHFQYKNKQKFQVILYVGYICP